MLETNLKSEKLFLLPYFQNLKSATNFDPQVIDGNPFSTGNLQKSEFFRKKVTYTLSRSAPEPPLKSATLWGSCCLRTTLVAKNF